MKPAEPITSLNRLRLPNGATLKISTKPTDFREQVSFRIEAVDSKDRVANPPVFVGTQSVGRASDNIRGWVDGTYYEQLNFEDGSTRNLASDASDLEFFKNLGRCIAPGGSLMVSYTLFSGASRVHTETSEGLDLGFPPAATPIGFLLLVAGCGFGFKDWYFAEGGREGPEKLQGFKPLTEADARLRTQALVKELESFFKQEVADGPLLESAKRRARDALGLIREDRLKF